MPINNFVDRVSSLDDGYSTGDLSLFPEALDNKEQLYVVSNESETSLTQTLGYTSRFVLVEDTSKFPPYGLITIGQEQIYYSSKTSNQFKELKRGFAGSRQGQWSVGTKVYLNVCAEPRNSIKDAIINIETKLGTAENPSSESLNGLLKNLENKFLAPKPIFQCQPRAGTSPLTVTFQNFSGGDPIRYLWDFGDGSTSTEMAPVHTYLNDGLYTVKLNMITTLGAQGIAVKTDYILVDSSLGPQFFYATPLVGTTSTEFSFVDQTTGNVSSRYWIFDDGNKETQEDPDIHFTSHIYSEAGTYNPTLLIVFDNKKLIRLELPEPIIIV